MKTLKFNRETRLTIKKGIDAVADAVKTTLGAKGRVVVISRKDINNSRLTEVHVTKDGVTVAKEVELNDPVENVGCNIIKSVASKTVTDSGDGTTTACILTQSIYNNCLTAIDAGANPVILKKQIDEAVKEIVAQIKEQAKPINSKGDFYKVGLIASNGDVQIAELVSEGFDKTGGNGSIISQVSNKKHTEILYSGGYEFGRGYLTSYFINNPHQRTCELENCDVFLYQGKITNHQQILDALQVSASMKHSFLLICKEINEESLAFLVKLKNEGKINPCVVREPAFDTMGNDMMEDLSVVTDAKGEVTINGRMVKFGFAKRVVVEEYSTMIIDGAGSKESLAERVEALTSQLDKPVSEYYLTKLKYRIAHLSNGVATIFVGGDSEVEIKERKDRFDDTICAVKAASQEGVLPGGGVSLLHFIKTPSTAGENALKEALRQPFIQLCENAGVNPKQILQELENSYNKNLGFDVEKEIVCDMVEAGIIDPAKVIRVAIENAASVASLLATSNCMIVEHNGFSSATVN